MLALFRAKERIELNWKDLFKQTNKRLKIVRMHYKLRRAGLVKVRLKST
jgi:hypothetical protein